jgi:hypothetical protein
MFPLLLLAAAGVMSCPVLTTATARGAIGEVQLKVTHSEKNSGYTCEFTGNEIELTVEVSTLPGPGQFSRFADTACQGGRDILQLKAIGNEAVACSSGAAEKVVGRVRNQAFLIRLNSIGAAKPSRSAARDLAETVAGNLF